MSSPSRGIGSVGLPAVAVPQDVRDIVMLGDTKVYFFERLMKIKANGHVHEKIFIITDRNALLCSPKGSVKRSFAISAIGEILRKAPNYIGLKIPSEYDVLLLVKAAEDADKIVHVLMTLYRTFSSGDFLPLTDVPPGTILSQEMCLSRATAGGSPGSSMQKPAGTGYRELDRAATTLHSISSALRGDGSPPAPGDSRDTELDRMQLRLMQVDPARSSSRRDQRDREFGLSRPSHYGVGGGGYGASDGLCRDPRLDALVEATSRLADTIAHLPLVDRDRSPDSPRGGSFGRTNGSGGDGLRDRDRPDNAPPVIPKSAERLLPLPDEFLLGTDELILHYQTEPNFAENHLTHDPRTGLPLVPVPPDHLQAFADLQDAVLHFFSPAIIVQHDGSRMQCIVVVTDEFLFIAEVFDAGPGNVQKVLQRCFPVVHIDKIYHAAGGIIALVVPYDYDLLLQFATDGHVQSLMRVLVRTHKYRSAGTQREPLSPIELPREQLFPPQPGLLDLQEPPGWQLTRGPFRSRQALEDCVIARTRLLNMERQRINTHGRQILNERIKKMHGKLCAELYKNVVGELEHLHAHHLDSQKERDALKCRVAELAAENNELRDSLRMSRRVK